jgi:hypothetical protein
MKIKVFGWYLRKGVILIKDNLAKRNWHGSKECVFIIKMRQLNIYSSNADFRCIWSVIQLASTLYQPTTVANLFENWLKDVDDRFKKHIRVGVIAIIWSL